MALHFGNPWRGCNDNSPRTSDAHSLLPILSPLISPLSTPHSLLRTARAGPAQHLAAPSFLPRPSPWIPSVPRPSLPCPPGQESSVLFSSRPTNPLSHLSPPVMQFPQSISSLPALPPRAQRQVHRRKTDNGSSGLVDVHAISSHMRRRDGFNSSQSSLSPPNLSTSTPLSSRSPGKHSSTFLAAATIDDRHSPLPGPMTPDALDSRSAPTAFLPCLGTSHRDPQYTGSNDLRSTVTTLSEGLGLPGVSSQAGDIVSQHGTGASDSNSGSVAGDDGFQHDVVLIPPSASALGRRRDIRQPSHSGSLLFRPSSPIESPYSTTIGVFRRDSESLAGDDIFQQHVPIPTSTSASIKHPNAQITSHNGSPLIDRTSPFESPNPPLNIALGQRKEARHVSGLVRGHTTVWYESCSPAPIAGPPKDPTKNCGDLFVHFHHGGHQIWLKDATGVWITGFEGQQHPLNRAYVLHIRPSAEPLWVHLP